MRATPPVALAFKYSKLSSTASSIRLLELVPSVSNRINSTLKEFRLNEAPSFNALSYTWGSPLTHLSASSSLLQQIKARDGRHEDVHHKRSNSITCDGAALPVTTNLRDALLMLQKTDLENATASDTKYIWIDAICVNQNDIAERNDQVSLMSDIFRSAHSVVVWLGPEDEFTADALKVLETIGSLPEDAGESAEEDYTRLFDGDNCATYARLGISPLKYHHWLGFLAFINRPWFERAWVVQELALANAATVICGKHRIPWRWMSRTLRFIQTTRWYHHLSSAKLRHVQELRDHSGIYHELLQSDISIKMTALYLDRTRMRVADSQRPRGDQPPKNGLPLRTLIETHRFTKTTDARDKVYALLGLADQNGAPFKSLSEEDTIRADYNLSTQQLYLDTTRAFLLSSRNLGFMSNVQDPSQTVTEGLPSWVPDFSVEQQPYPLMFRGFPRWRANGRGGPRWEPDASAMRDGLLRVQGICIDRVASVVKLQNECDNPSEFWSDIVKVASELNDRCPISYFSGFHPSRVEVLWRTLMTNTYQRKCPAPSSCGELFIDYILNLQIRHSLSPWSIEVDFQPHQAHVAEDIVPQWHTLLAAEPEDSPYGLALYKERFSEIVGRMFKGGYNPVRLSQLHHELENSSGSVRRVFRTQSQLLGTGARSLQAGDEIWILRGASVPFVLRRMANGRYRLVGEAYVHGVMVGKALTMGFEVQEIVIE
ncbi:HET-domain-containing protein [Pseudovirgaria hyperparasitica]|uniref:HET-domain-containing protein n=1 Tax=Pseudovirgaria hyperparasitica TaxID=470096 RepID=A0A6A6WLI2_9PEZI|nr:HET-domain-containing protein [Pseudovirgaria hyperparasitica]KAF2763008.1 HET-domain-containing protein [Pseudovirgaria hyperparasitica]